MNVLVIDIGGNNVKILASGQNEARKFSSGPSLTPQQMVAAVKNSPRTGSMTLFRWAIRGWWSKSAAGGTA